MDPIKLLKEDHKKVKGLFAKYEDCEEDDIAMKGELCEMITRELEIHATLEEEIFYPALKDALDDDAMKYVLEAIEEHEQVKTLIADLRAMKPGEETFDAKVKVLFDNVEHHVKEEENEMMPRAKRVLTDAALEELGVEMSNRKEELMVELEAGGPVMEVDVEGTRL